MLPDKTPVYQYSHTLRSRYSETDKMGYVYYGHYLAYFEAARTEMIRSAGISYRELEENGFMLPVVESHTNYKAPLFYDDLVTIKVSLFELPAIKLKTWYEIYTDRQKSPHAVGKVVLCFVDAETRKPRKAPVGFVERLEKPD